MQSSISPSPNWFKPSTSTWGDPSLAEFLSLCCGAAPHEAAGPRAQQAPALVRQSTCAGVCVCACVHRHTPALLAVGSSALQRCQGPRWQGCVAEHAAARTWARLGREEAVP